MFPVLFFFGLAGAGDWLGCALVVLPGRLAPVVLAEVADGSGWRLFPFGPSENTKKVKGGRLLALGLGKGFALVSLIL